MNRAGLFVVLSAAVLAGALFAIFPQLDLKLAALFYDSSSHQFSLGPTGLAQFVRRAAMWISWALAVPALISPIWKMIRPDRPLLLPARAGIFLAVTIFLCAVVFPNLVFKSYWGRPRPINTVEFGGAENFRPWWDPRGSHRPNGSFFSGEAATAFWTFAPASLTPPQARPFAYALAAIFGLTTGALRMAFGAHYASDVLAAGISSFLVVWLAHALLYRWPKKSIDDDGVDRWFTERLRKIPTGSSLVAIILLLTIARLVALHFSVVDLFPDEARYWAWGQKPAFGYFSKPPLIAWTMALTSWFFGNAEPALRSVIPLFYAGTALIGAAIARQLYGREIAWWSGLSRCAAWNTSRRRSGEPYAVQESRYASRKRAYQASSGGR